MATKTHHDEEFVTFIVQHIADKFDEFEIERVEDDLGTLLKIHAPKEEIGKVIGKNRRHLEAIKTLLRVITAKTGKGKTSIKVIEKE